MSGNASDTGKDVRALDFVPERLGPATLESPLRGVSFACDSDRVSYYSDASVVEAVLARGEYLPAFESAGPREEIYHDPSSSRAAIVNCGGLCPGLNDVIRALVNTMFFSYGIRRVHGIQYGFRGLVPSYGLDSVPLDPDTVDLIHEDGGSILGSSRGPQDAETMVRTLERMGINLLFCIGGDGTMRGACAIAQAARDRGLFLSVVGVPKTIDNDLGFMTRTFGFETAVYAAGPVISCAHAEAKGVYNGIGLVRLMGRDSGFIAATATLSNSVVNFCLVPEVPFELDGPSGFLPALARRLVEKQHAVIVAAEGAGQGLFGSQADAVDASGNVVHQDIGTLLRARIEQYLRGCGIEHSLKYFDPSYVIRSVPARGTDAVFCLLLAENAVHAALAGRTNMVIGHWHDRFVHVPIALATRERRKIDPGGQLWQSVLGVTLQQRYWQPGLSSAG